MNIRFRHVCWCRFCALWTRTGRQQTRSSRLRSTRCTPGDFRLDKDSVAAGIYAAWQRQLWEQFRNTHVPAALQESFASIVVTPLINSLLAPDGSYGPDPLAGRDQFIRESFKAAVQSLVTRFGSDMNNWTYGQTAYHHIVIKHMLSDAVNAELRARLDVGPIPRGGDSFTVNNTGSEDLQTVGASFSADCRPQ